MFGRRPFLLVKGFVGRVLSAALRLRGKDVIKGFHYERSFFVLFFDRFGSLL
ncbi:hypothetical protein SDC9_145368 [bioreactor metagenome]|uniref:Uncharacterized protein n=1 Tax=bioreactor metagenome TaxID=1076179 RepID=A0A645E9P5_9ZZZZ